MMPFFLKGKIFDKGHYKQGILAEHTSLIPSKQGL